SPDEYGSYFEYAVGTADPSPSAQAIYTPTLPTAAKYDVSIWYPQGSNRATNTPVTTFYNGGYILSAVDQTSNGGGWRLLASALDFPVGSTGFALIGNNT